MYRVEYKASIALYQISNTEKSRNRHVEQSIPPPLVLIAPFFASHSLQPGVAVSTATGLKAAPIPCTFFSCTFRLSFLLNEAPPGPRLQPLNLQYKRDRISEPGRRCFWTRWLKRAGEDLNVPRDGAPLALGMSMEMCGLEAQSWQLGGL